MAATNSTTNYGLPQWVATDKPEMTDFNTAMSDIDTSINLVQSGGADGAFANMPFVGTAPIIESGSNANGSYVKYADGTMICRHKIITTLVMTTATGSCYRSIITDWTFPVAFVGTYFFSVQPFSTSDTRHVWGSVQNAISPTSATYCVLSPISTTWELHVSLSAIGRWK